MIDIKTIRKTVCSGLSKYLHCPIIRSSQNEEPPKYPYISFTIITPLQTKGTWQTHSDGIERQWSYQTWSISSLSDDNDKSVENAVKAKEWFTHFGSTYLNDHNVIIQDVGNVTNRDNILTVGYEYNNGFDVTFALYDISPIPYEETSWIETAPIEGDYNGT